MISKSPFPLEVNRGVDPNLFGNVHFDDDDEARFGGLSTETDQSFGRIFRDSALGAFRIEATRDGVGAFEPITFFTADGEAGRFDNTTVRRFFVGRTTPIDTNSIAEFERSLAQATTLLVSNPLVDASSSAIIVAQNDAATGVQLRINGSLNTSSGFLPNEGGVFAAGPSIAAGGCYTQTAIPWKFTINQIERARFTPLGELIIGGTAPLSTELFRVVGASVIQVDATSALSVTHAAATIAGTTLTVDTVNNRIGIGGVIAPAVVIDALNSTAFTTSSATMLRISHESTATPGVGFGVRFVMRLDNDANSLIRAFRIATLWVSAAAGLETSQAVIQVRESGSNINIMTLHGTDGVNANLNLLLDRNLRMSVATEPQLTANENDLVIEPTVYHRMSSDASRNVSGIAFQQDNAYMIIVNVGSFDLVYLHQSALSALVNRFISPTGADVTLSPNDALHMIYDGTNNAWRIVVITL